MNDLKIRESRADDYGPIETLYNAAFPDEDLVPLVRDLLDAGPAVLSLVAVRGSPLVAHIAFTFCTVGEIATPMALLGPLAVDPACQRQGVGTHIVRAGLPEMETAGVGKVLVLGDPAYYGRFGFVKETLVTPPYALPAEWDGAWQSLTLGDNEPSLKGRLIVMEAWDKRELWAP